MLVTNGFEKFPLVEFPMWIGRKIQYNGSAIFSVSDNGHFGFLKTKELYDSIEKLPVLYRLYAKWVVKRSE